GDYLHGGPQLVTDNGLRLKAYHGFRSKTQLIVIDTTGCGLHQVERVAVQGGARPNRHKPIPINIHCVDRWSKPQSRNGMTYKQLAELHNPSYPMNLRRRTDIYVLALTLT